MNPFWTQTAHAAIVTASSCNQSDVQSAINQAVDGDMVLVPGGQCTWTTTATQTPSVVLTGKSILIKGAGSGSTIITDATGAGWREEPVWVDQASGFRITGFTFRGMQRRSSTEPAITITQTCLNWRLDHVTLYSSDMAPGTQGRGVSVGGEGLVDHCTFLDSYTGVTVGGDGDASWLRPLSLGSSHAVYIEDNAFMGGTSYAGDGALDAYNGARYVFRYNVLQNVRAGHHGFDSGPYRSPHSVEYYHNTITMLNSNYWYGIRFRGATGVLWSNEFRGNFPEVTMGVVNYRTCCEVSHNNCWTWGRCDGDNPLDGNLPGMMGYPCRDQVGRSTDTNADGLQDQAPVYEWDNTVNGADADITVNDPWGCTNPSMNDHLKENRDFVNDTQMPGYAPYQYPHPLTYNEQYIMTVTTAGGGSGVVTSVPNGINCGSVCRTNFSSGANVTLTATPSIGSAFVGWAGACAGTQATCTVSIDGDESATAIFEILYTLTVAKDGTGSGTVTSTPAGINCGGDCSHSYPNGSSVMLTAAADAGSMFTGWSGACSGKGTCVVTINSDTAVTATFLTTVTLDGDASVTEGDSGTTGALFSARLPRVSGATVTVEYATIDGTADGGVDYTSISGTLTFSPGVTTQTLAVPVLGDTSNEPNERFYLNLTGASNATIADGQGIGTILDDDGGTIQIAELTHGFEQQADLASRPGPTADLDSYLLLQKPYSSYEVVVDGTSGDLGSDSGPILETVAADGMTILQTAVAAGTGPSRSLRVENASAYATEQGYVRVRYASLASQSVVHEALRTRT